MNHFLKICAILLAFISSSYAQCNKYVEELALNHLDSLTRNDKDYTDFKYFTNGYLESQDSYVPEQIKNRYSKSKSYTIIIKNPFSSCRIIEKSSLSHFPISKKLRREKTNSVLNIYHFIRIDNKYFVTFVISKTETSGVTVVLILNLTGDLIGIDSMTWIE